jgi:hypothetical protein
MNMFSVAEGTTQIWYTNPLGKTIIFPRNTFSAKTRALFPVGNDNESKVPSPPPPPPSPSVLGLLGYCTDTSVRVLPKFKFPLGQF